jgi:hypothetical protein
VSDTTLVAGYCGVTETMNVGIVGTKLEYNPLSTSLTFNITGRVTTGVAAGATLRVKLKNNITDATHAEADFTPTLADWTFNREMVMTIAAFTNYTSLDYYVKAWLIPTEDTGITVWYVLLASSCALLAPLLAHT